MTGGAGFGEWSAQDLQVPPDAGASGKPPRARRRRGARCALLIIGSVLGALVFVAFAAGVIVGVTHSSYYIPSKSMAPMLER